MNNDVMSHEQAVSKQAAERYLLAELSQEEREAFEGHYFDCVDCFEQVKLGAEFLRHTRHVLDPEPEKGWLARALGDLRRPVPAFVSATLVLAIGVGTYQHVQLVDARQPRAEASFFLPGTVKGLEKPISVSRRSRLSLSVDFKPASDFTAYRAQILSESGKMEYALPLTPRPDEYSVTLGLPAAALEAGKYSVVVQGVKSDGSAVEVGNGTFELQFTD